MLIFVSMLVCAISSHQCHRVIPEVPPQHGLVACERIGMFYAAKWQLEHRDYVVTRIDCSLGNRPQTDTNT